MPTFLVNHKVDGLIFMGEIDRRYLAAAIQHGLPFMLLDFYDDAIAADCVLSDNTSGSYMITEHLIETGRRNIAFVGSVLSTSSIMDRYLGYVKALLRARLPVRPDWLIEDRDSRGIFIPITLPVEMPDAFVCNCDEVAFNVVETLKAPRLPRPAGRGRHRLRRLPLLHHLQPAPDHPPGGRRGHGPHCGGPALPQNGPQAAPGPDGGHPGGLCKKGVDLSGGGFSLPPFWVKKNRTLPLGNVLFSYVAAGTRTGASLPRSR